MYVSELLEQIKQPSIIIIGNFILTIISLLSIFSVHYLHNILFSTPSIITQAIILLADVGIALLFVVKTYFDLINIWRKK